MASRHLLQGPAVAVRIAEVGVQDLPEILRLADAHPAVGQLRTRHVDVRDDQVQALDGARQSAHYPRPKCDRAGRSGWRQLDDAQLIGRPDVVLLIKPGFLGVEGLRTVHLGDGNQD